MEIVEGVLSEGEVCFIVGESTLSGVAALSLGLSVARGGEWMGWGIPQPRQVFCVHRQWNQEAFAEIVGAQLIDPQTKRPVTSTPHTLARFNNFSPDRGILCIPEGHEAVLRLVGQYKPALLLLISLDGLIDQDALRRPTSVNYIKLLHHLSRVNGVAVVSSTTTPTSFGSKLFDSPPDAIWEVQDDEKAVGGEGWTGTLRIRRLVGGTVQEIQRRTHMTPTLTFAPGSA